MAKRVSNKLSAREVTALTTPGRHADGNGLYLAVRPGGSRQWIFLYRWSGKLREMGLGPTSELTLKAAREKAAEARAMIGKGSDPLEVRHAATNEADAVPTFGEYAIALVDRIEGGFSNHKHRQQWRNTLLEYGKPIWSTRIDVVDTAGVLACLTPIWSTKPETASRLRGRIERVLSAAKAERLRAGENPAVWRGHLDATLPRQGILRRGHHAALAYTDMPGFIGELRAREALAALALEFCILTATRTQEALGAQWKEVDCDAGVWAIPPARMKARREHRVPLSKRALAILDQVGQARAGAFVFPGRRPDRPLSNMSMLMLLRRMNKAGLTSHGFRSTFSDWASEVSEFGPELRETALAHVIANKAEAAYRRGDALQKRRAMMEEWARWCEGCDIGDEHNPSVK
jgi:integrase